MATQSLVTVSKEVAKVMFLQVCICPQGGGGIPAGPAGGIPACLVAGLQGVTPAYLAWGVPGPGGELVWGVLCLVWVVPAPRRVPGLGGYLLWGAVERPPHQQTAIVADGTHPTGMHSCYSVVGAHPTGMLSCYQPQGKVMFSQASVIPSYFLLPDLFITRNYNKYGVLIIQQN